MLSINGKGSSVSVFTESGTRMPEKIKENAKIKRVEKKLKKSRLEAKRKETEKKVEQRAHEIHEEKVLG